jgi:lipopolysaccharide assembly outer membrane protein LptD (OstA)
MRFTPLGLAVLLTAAALGQDATPPSAAASPGSTNAPLQWVITSADGQGEVELDRKTNIATARNGVIARYGSAVLTARQIRLSPNSTFLEAEGDVSVQMTRPDGGTVLWRGQRVRYDYVHRTIEADQFRFGQAPYFAAGEQLRGGQTNQIQTAIEAMVTTDDVDDPAFRLKARAITVTDNKTVTAEDATVFAGSMPIFYFPRYTETLGKRRFFWSATPGYRNLWGGFVLGSFNQNWNDQVQTALELDYYSKRGPGIGPSVNYDLGKWGQGQGQFYYVNDRDPGNDFFGNPISEHRERVYFTHTANPWDDFYAKAAVRYQSDANIIHDFFEDEYRANTQPLTLLEGQQLWKNFSMGVSVVPQVNSFQQQVTRLPELSVNGARQQLGPTPFYYESQSSAGYLEFRGGDYSSTNYAAFRADSLHQILLPYNAFGWLNIEPRVGGRYTHYSDATGIDLDAQNRWMLNTGAEVSAKASALWRGVENETLELNGLRHVIQPSFNYTYVPTPNVLPSEIPQFDRRVPSLELEPVNFPDNNSIDSLGYRNVVRLSLFNLLQTKRGGMVQPFVSWQLYTDWNVGELEPGQNTFSDAYSRIYWQPRTWIGYANLVRYDVAANRIAEFDNVVRLTPNDVWSWTLGNRYIVADPDLGMLDSRLYYSSLAYRMNENWSLRMTQQYEAETQTMEAQYYTLSRDFRSWVGALTVRIRDNGPNGIDWTIGVAFQLKAANSVGTMGSGFGPDRLLGYWR